MKTHLERLRASAEKSIAKFRSALSHEQQVCEHRNLEGCEYLPMEFDGSLRPMRVCCDRGLSEEGWGCGYVVLKGQARPISRNDLYAKRFGFFVTDEHKGRLLRHEVTVAKLISDES